jgi:hypothetical protein
MVAGAARRVAEPSRATLGADRDGVTAELAAVRIDRTGDVGLAVLAHVEATRRRLTVATGHRTSVTKLAHGGKQFRYRHRTSQGNESRTSFVTAVPRETRHRLQRPPGHLRRVSYEIKSGAGRRVLPGATTPASRLRPSRRSGRRHSAGRARRRGRRVRSRRAFTAALRGRWGWAAYSRPGAITGAAARPV